MIGQIIVWLIIIAAFAMMFRIVLDAHKKEKWFNSLKPGDNIVVWIYSEYCECMRDAVITKSSNGKFIEAEIIDIEKCKTCSEFHSKDKSGKETCWYNVQSFTKKDVGLKDPKIK